MFWSKSIFTLWRPVFMPTLRSRKNHGIGERLQFAEPLVQRGFRSVLPTDAVPRKISVPSRLVMPIAQDLSPGFGVVDVRLHLLALEGRVAVMRGQAAGLEPGLAPDFLAQRRELAEMGWPLDGAALKSQSLRGGIVVD